MFKTITQKIDWDQALEEVDAFDFYHTYDYHFTASKKDEKPILLYYNDSHSIIALPLVIRAIPDTNYFDATSVYGYGGPLSKNVTSNSNLTDFHTQLRRFFKEKKIITVFSSLNPYIPNQKKIISGLGKIESQGKVVNINITQNNEAQELQFSKTTKRYIKRNQHLFYARVGNTESDALLFMELYYKTMTRLHAHENYYFPEAYFKNILKSDSFKAQIIFAITKDSHQIVSAALMVKTNHNIIQYHLSGTLEAYKNLSPMRFLINEIRLQGTAEGYTHFNLGGGFGSKQDSLFNFKASFSKDRKKFKTWKYILNHQKYNSLSKENKHITATTTTTFFPLYRYKK